MSNAPTRLVQVVRAGLLTTVQDLGRHGFQPFGVSVSGAMDGFALLVGNRLVGNSDHAAGLEITVQGPELYFEQACTIAVTGADLSPTLDGCEVPLWASVPVPAGATLRMGLRRGGARAYLAVEGGIAVPLCLGSRSTHLRSQTGGWQGRALKAGDCVPLGQTVSRPQANRCRELPERLRPSYAACPTLRVVAGAHYGLFTPEAHETLVRTTYRLTSQSDRMGYRLEGEPLLRYQLAADLLSDATLRGSLQVPPSQQPILLMADCQTTGGYPSIAVVCSADIPFAAQVLPGERVRFAWVERSAAIALFAHHIKQLAAVLPPCRQ